MSSSFNERGTSGCREARGNSLSLLSLVDLPVPPSVRLGWGKHSTTSTHVTERTLSRSMSTSSGNTRDSRHGSASSPGVGTVLVSSNNPGGSKVDLDTICLSRVLSHIGMNKLHQISSEWAFQDVNHLGRATLFTIGIQDCNVSAICHCDFLI